jgi:hypothetical protein
VWKKKRWRRRMTSFFETKVLQKKMN